jgi:hypothetical protein
MSERCEKCGAPIDARQASLTGRKCLRCFTTGRLSAKSAPATPASTASGDTAPKASPHLRIPDKPKLTVIGYSVDGAGDTPPQTFSRLVSTKISEEQYTAAQRIIDADPNQFPSWYAFLRAAVASFIQAHEAE